MASCSHVILFKEAKVLTEQHINPLEDMPKFSRAIHEAPTTLDPTKHTQSNWATTDDLAPDEVA